MKYIVINKDKVPQHSLDQYYSLEEVKDYDNLAVIVDEPVVILDVDDNEEANILIKILDNYNIKTNIMKTDRGAHFWFKTREPLVNSIGINTPITLKVDVKSWGKKSMSTVKKNGVWREWIRQENDLAELPFWLTPIKIRKDLKGLTDGDGRNDALFTYIIPLLKHKFSKKQIEIIFNIINEFIFATPLAKRELQAMFDNNEIFDETMAFFEKNLFLHHEFAFWMKENHPIEYIKGQLYLYDNGLYKPNPRGIEEIMIRKIPKLTIKNRNEVNRYIELICTDNTNKIKPLMINTLSGIYDLEKNMLLPHTDKIFSINQIPAFCNIGAYHERTDQFLNEISGNDKNIRTLLEELIGYCLINDCRFQKAFILLGGGSNGKSVFLKMLTEFLGDDNISSIPLEDLNGKFETAEIADKLANIADDISSEFLEDSSTFKKLVTGDKITAQRKYGQPFQFNNSAKLLFSANVLPPLSDKSFGLYRRLIIIPFLQSFKEGDPNYDPNLLTKLKTPEAKAYLLSLGIKAIQRVIERKSFTVPEIVTNIVTEYVKDNNNCIQWLEESARSLDEVDVNDAYKTYCVFCMTNGTKAYKKGRFIQEVTNKMPTLRIKNTTRSGRFTQVFTEK